MSSTSDELNYECDEALSESSAASSDEEEGEEADESLSNLLDTSIKPPPPTPVPRIASPKIFRPISPKGSRQSVVPVKPIPRKKSPIRPPSSVKSVKSVVIQRPPRYSPVSPPVCPEGPAAEPVLEVPSRTESPPQKQYPPPAQFRRKPNRRLPMVSGGKNRLMHQSVKDYRTLIEVRKGKGLEGVEPDPKAVFAKQREPPPQTFRGVRREGRPDLTTVNKIPLTQHPTKSWVRETPPKGPVRNPDWRWVGCMKKPKSRRIHVHQRQLACMCVVVKEGYSISNGAATVSSDDVSDVMDTLCEMNVKSLVVTDEETMNHWNTLKKGFSTFHPLNTVNVVMIDKDRQHKIGKCIYCKQTVCHKWRAVMAMSMTIRHGLDHVKHEKKEETQGK